MKRKHIFGLLLFAVTVQAYVTTSGQGGHFPQQQQIWASDSIPTDTVKSDTVKSDTTKADTLLTDSLKLQKKGS